jgi:hypothetical protein
MPLKKTESAFKRPPNFTYLGFEGRKQLLQRQDAPAIRPDPNLPIELHQVHQRASLLHGELLVKDSLKAGRSKVILFIDNSASCQAFFNKKHELNQLVDTICSWLSHHHWEWEVHFSEPNPGFKWGSQLWDVWHQHLNSQHDSIALVLSDFHGEFPTGMFWKQLQTLPDTRLIWWQHPFDQTSDRDIEDPPELYRKLSNDFLQQQKSWYHKLSETFSQMGLNHKKIKTEPYQKVEQQIAQYVS